MTPFVLYNWLQDSAIPKLVIDVRDPALFDIGYIKTAINVPIADDSPEDQELDLKALNDSLTPKNKMLKNRGLIYTHLVIYDGNGEGTPAKRLVNALVKEKKALNVKLLQGGYQTFVVQFPFLSSSSSKKAIGGTYPSAIVDSFLYLGSHDHAKSKQQLKDLGISHIVNMAGELENEYPDDFKYLSVKLDDTSGDNITQHFEKTLKFLEEAQAASAKVLVHCAMGISRSSTIVIAYLMHHKGMSYEEAHQFVKSMRSCIKPNPGFMTQLVEFEKKMADSKEAIDLIKAAEAMHISDQQNQAMIPTSTLHSITDSLSTPQTTTISTTTLPATITTSTTTLPIITPVSTPTPVLPIPTAVPPPIVPPKETSPFLQTLEHIVEKEK